MLLDPIILRDTQQWLCYRPGGGSVRRGDVEAPLTSAGSTGGLGVLDDLDRRSLTVEN